MSYIALYRKWRPKAFSDVVEQTHVVRALQNTVISKRIAHAYLFCGTRGTGKTTIAKIFARAINCLNPTDGNPCNECEICKGILNESLLDVIEIDAASNNGVDNIREIRDEVTYAPARAAYKVYIIDEVHMLSSGAFNALLKTLEEPPEHVVFILATTDPHKLPATILSRCQRFDFKRISAAGIVERIEYIAKQSSASIEKDAATAIARLADGALRDAVSILDQCISISGDTVTLETVRSITGISNSKIVSDMLQAIIDLDTSAIFEYIENLTAHGKDMSKFNTDLINYCRDILVCIVTSDPKSMVNPLYNLDIMKQQATQLSLEHLSYIIRELSELDSKFRLTTQPRILLESTLIRVATMTPTIDTDLFKRINLIEQRLANAPTNIVPPTRQTNITSTNASSSENNSTASSNASSSVAPTNAPHKEKILPGKFDKWQNVLNDLVAFQHLLCGNVLKGSSAYVINDSTIGIVPTNPAQINLLKDNSYREAIKASVGRVTSREYSVKVYNSEDDLPENLAPSKPQQVEKQDDVSSKLSEIAKMADVPFDIEE